MFWSCDQNNAENAPMFSLLLSSANTKSRAPASQASLSIRSLGVHKKLRGDIARTADTNNQRDTAYHMILCSAVESQEKVGLIAFVFPNNHYKWFLRKLCFHLNICLTRKSNDLIPNFALLVCSFVLPIKLSLSQPTNFLTFDFPLLFTTLQQQNERAAVWGGAAYQG